MAGRQDQAVGAPTGSANDTRWKTQFNSKDALAPVAASPCTRGSNFETKRCGASGAVRR